MQESSHAVRLPPHWELAAPLAGAEPLGAVYEARDRRLAGENPPTVVVRILEGTDQAADWPGPLWERVARLIADPMPHVSPLLDAGRDVDACWLVSPRHDVCAWSLLTQDRGLEEPVATAALEQLLEGLAALHRRGLAHGDVRARNVFFDHPKSGRPTVWLADAAVGPLTWWSRGTFLSNDARRYYPPEWRGAPQEPTPAADVYALGLTACELLLGREALPAPNGDGAEGESLAAELSARLQAAGVAAALRKLLAAMLADDPTQRLADGEEALHRWRTAAAPPRRRRTALLALAAALAGAAVGYYAGDRGKPALRDNLAAATREGEQAQGQLNAAKQQLAQLEAAFHRQEQVLEDQTKSLETERAERQRLAGRIAELEQTVVSTAAKPPPQESISPETIAQQHWAALLGAAEGQSLTARLEQAVRDGVKHQPADEGKAEYRAYYNRVRRFRSRPHLTVWLEEDARLAALAEDLLKSPWDDGAVAQAEARHAALEEAARLWAAWSAPQSRMTWEGIRVQIEGKEGLSDETRRILRGWFAAVEEQAARGWTLLLRRGECQEGYGVDRIVRVYVDGQQAGQPSFHAWDSPTAHRYQGEAARIPFAWRPGQSFGLSLEQDGALYNTNIVTVHYQNPFDGPLALWAANRAGATESKLGKLAFEIKANAGDGRLAPLPGPPEAALVNLAETLRNLLDKPSK